MASGAPVVLSPDPALREVAGEAAVYADDGDYAAAVRRALAEREERSRLGIDRARRFTWEETARRTADVYRQVLAA
jgi:glycosyltransferase involved in cell wall biosynthesis